MPEARWPAGRVHCWAALLPQPAASARAPDLAAVSVRQRPVVRLTTWAGSPPFGSLSCHRTAPCRAHGARLSADPAGVASLRQLLPRRNVPSGATVQPVAAEPVHRPTTTPVPLASRHRDRFRSTTPAAPP